MSLGAQVSEIFSAQVSACPSHSLHAGVFWFVFALQKCCNRYVGFYVLLFPQDLHFSRNSVDLDPCAVFRFTNTLEPV